MLLKHFIGHRIHNRTEICFDSYLLTSILCYNYVNVIIVNFLSVCRIINSAHHLYKLYVNYLDLMPGNTIWPRICQMHQIHIWSVEFFSSFQTSNMEERKHFSNDRRWRLFKAYVQTCLIIHISLKYTFDTEVCNSHTNVCNLHSDRCN